MNTRDELLDAVEAKLRQAAAGDLASVLAPETADEAQRLAALLTEDDGDLNARQRSISISDLGLRPGWRSARRRRNTRTGSVSRGRRLRGRDGRSRPRHHHPGGRGTGRWNGRSRRSIGAVRRAFRVTPSMVSGCSGLIARGDLSGRRPGPWLERAVSLSAWQESSRPPAGGFSCLTRLIPDRVP
jgi:hypothetical protein